MPSRLCVGYEARLALHALTGIIAYAVFSASFLHTWPVNAVSQRLCIGNEHRLALYVLTGLITSTASLMGLYSLSIWFHISAFLKGMPEFSGLDRSAFIPSSPRSQALHWADETRGISSRIRQ
jgi:hypothetical protein